MAGEVWWSERNQWLGSTQSVDEPAGKVIAKWAMAVNGSIQGKDQCSGALLLRDVGGAGCDVATLGVYLCPSNQVVPRSLPVVRR